MTKVAWLCCCLLVLASSSTIDTFKSIPNTDLQNWLVYNNSLSWEYLVRDTPLEFKERYNSEILFVKVRRKCDPGCNVAWIVKIFFYAPGDKLKNPYHTYQATLKQWFNGSHTTLEVTPRGQENQNLTLKFDISGTSDVMYSYAAVRHSRGDTCVMISCNGYRIKLNCAKKKWMDFRVTYKLTELPGSYFSALVSAKTSPFNLYGGWRKADWVDNQEDISVTPLTDHPLQLLLGNAHVGSSVTVKFGMKEVVLQPHEKLVKFVWLPATRKLCREDPVDEYTLYTLYVESSSKVALCIVCNGEDSNSHEYKQCQEYSSMEDEVTTIKFEESLFYRVLSSINFKSGWNVGTKKWYDKHRKSLDPAKGTLQVSSFVPQKANSLNITFSLEIHRKSSTTDLHIIWEQFPLKSWVHCGDKQEIKEDKNVYGLTAHDVHLTFGVRLLHSKLEITRNGIFMLLLPLRSCGIDVDDIEVRFSWPMNMSDLTFNRYQLHPKAG